MTEERFGSLYSRGVILKAEDFVASGKVAKIGRAWWEVRSTKTYVVRANLDWETTGIHWMTCTCPLRDHVESLISYCSHALAVRMIEQR